MRVERADVAIVGGGAAGLRAALEIVDVARRDGDEPIVALISKVYPMRSHTVAAEGGAAGVARDDDSAAVHIADTLAGGAGLCEREAVDLVVDRAPAELALAERWGMPWSRDDDGRPAVRAFGGMSRPRTWFAADKTGFHLLHTLFQTTLRSPSIRRYDEHLALDLVVGQEGGERRVNGVVVYDQHHGEPVLIVAPAVILATGGAARVYATSSNAGICTGDGLAMALRAGVALRDMEFIQFHPTGLPGNGVLITEAARGEGGLLLDSHGERYLADYGLGPTTPVGEPVPLRMELGSRDRLSQAFWRADRDGRTTPTPDGAVVHLDLRHLGAERLAERLPLVVGLAKQFAGVNPADTVIPVRPTAHYQMGGILTDARGGTALPGLYAAGEAASTGLHGANRLGSNSLVETLVVGASSGRDAYLFARSVAGKAADGAQAGGGPAGNAGTSLADQAGALADQWIAMRGKGSQSPAAIRRELGHLMETEAGIYRDAEGLGRALAALDGLDDRYADVRVSDTSAVMNTDWAQAIELGAMLQVARAVVLGALDRTESRGAHQRLDYPDVEASTGPWHSVVAMNGVMTVGRHSVGATR